MRAALGRLALPVAAALLLVRPAAAYFEEREVGARALGLGHAFVSVADDASAVTWNPAGLVLLARHELLVAIDEAPALDGLHRGFAACAVHVPGVSLGAGWQTGGLSGALREDVVTLAAARTLLRRSLGAYVAAGGAVKLARVGADTDDFPGLAALHGSATGVAADLGVLAAPIPNVTAGIAVRNLGQPEFDLVEGGSRTRLGAELEWGVSLRWREDGWLHVSRLHRDVGNTETHAAVELRVAGALGVRAGLQHDAVTGGLGVSWSAWTLDAAVRTQAVLGTTTRIGLRRAFGTPRATVGGTFDDF